MLINRNFQDYYDAAIGFGVDKQIVYNRRSVEYKPAFQKKNPKIIDDVQDVLRRLEDQWSHLATHPYGMFHVGFCGKIYTGFYARVDPKTCVPVTSFTMQQAHSLPKAFYWCEKDFLPGEFDKPRSRYCYRDPVTNGPTLREWYKRNQALLAYEALDIFVEHKVVSFVVLDNTLVTDPCLKDFNFQRVIGGVETFQEISMFLSGVLGQPDRSMIDLDDKYRVMAHGFDKHSFRKGPTKR